MTTCKYTRRSCYVDMKWMPSIQNTSPAHYQRISYLDLRLDYPIQATLTDCLGRTLGSFHAGVLSLLDEKDVIRRRSFLHMGSLHPPTAQASPFCSPTTSQYVHCQRHPQERD
jgi:hypothetical protein